PAFVLCELSAAQRPTAAPLRLALRPAGADALAVRVLKRRGPPLEAALQLALPPVLSEAARQRAQAGIEGPALGHVPTPPPGSLRAATFVNLAAG
ncbi:MAG TPA: hypothetical protein VNU48_04020, partial [Burkholderiaceae bacterium]|nr:hypothetical protein [Burkholderiaceae bacterium]